MKLSEQELSCINGGVLKLAIGTKIAIVGGFAVFVAGFIGGYLRPSTCKSGK